MIQFDTSITHERRTTKLQDGFGPIEKMRGEHFFFLQIVSIVENQKIQYKWYKIIFKNI